MYYILIRVDGIGDMYQEVDKGIVVRHTSFEGQTIEVPAGHVSWVLDANPVQPAWALPDSTPIPSVATRRITKQQFIDRFSPAEMSAILATAKADVNMEAWLFRFNAATPEADGTSIDLDDPRTIGGVIALEYFGIIGVGRGTEVLC